MRCVTRVCLLSLGQGATVTIERDVCACWCMTPSAELGERVLAVLV